MKPAAPLPARVAHTGAARDPEPAAPIAAGCWHRGGTLRAWGRTELPRTAAFRFRAANVAEKAIGLAASRSTAPGLVVLSLTPRELPTRR
jgi:hypothetical protein